MLSSVNISSVIYKITYIKQVVDDKNNACDGLTDLDKKTMQIDNTLSKVATNKTVLHEVIEAMNDEFAIKLNHRQIELLECAIFDTWKRNNLKEVFE